MVEGNKTEEIKAAIRSRAAAREATTAANIRNIRNTLTALKKELASQIREIQKQKQTWIEAGKNTQDAKWQAIVALQVQTFENEASILRNYGEMFDFMSDLHESAWTTTNDTMYMFEVIQFALGNRPTKETTQDIARQELASVIKRKYLKLKQNTKQMRQQVKPPNPKLFA